MGKIRKFFYPALTLCFLLILTGIFLTRLGRGGVSVEVSVSMTTQASEGSLPAERSLPDTPLVNINTADLETLQTLPMIGPARAQKIIAYREENGPFTSLSDLMKVSGIGQSVYHTIQSKICLEDNDENTDH